MSEMKLGQLTNHEAQRDSVHIAILPLMALTQVRPGQHLGLSRIFKMSLEEPFIGIVDPFLKKPVEKYQWFNLCLYPDSVISMRHHWRAWWEEQRTYGKLQEIATICRLDVPELMSYARNMLENDEYELDNSERYKEVDWVNFWKLYQEHTNRQFPRDPEELGPPFTCSC